MKPQPTLPQTRELFRPRLDEQLNMKHPLVRLADLMNWEEIERSFSAHAGPAASCKQGREPRCCLKSELFRVDWIVKAGISCPCNDTFSA